MAVVVATDICAKRARNPPGFYRALHNRSNADILGVGLNDRGHKHGRLRVPDTDPLPEVCYEVERLVAKRRKKVLPAVAFMHSVVDIIKP